MGTVILGYLLLGAILLLACYKDVFDEDQLVGIVTIFFVVLLTPICILMSTIIVIMEYISSNKRA